VKQRKLFKDRRADAFEVLQYFVIPEPQHAEPFAIEKFCSFAVVLRDIGVLTAIDLDYEAM
jgi:hypothetical protein